MRYVYHLARHVYEAAGHLAMIRTLHLAGTLCAAGATLVGIGSLALWALGEWRLTVLGSTYSPISYIAAALFAALGLPSMARRVWPEHPRTRRFEVGVAWVTIVASAIVLVQHWTEFPAPWESWFSHPGLEAGPIPVGRVAPMTAIAFILTSITVLARGGPEQFRGFATLAPAVASLLIALSVIAAFLTGAPLDYSDGHVPMSLLAALTFVLLNGSVFLDGDVLRRALLAISFDPAANRRGRDQIFAVRLCLGTVLLAMAITGIGIAWIRLDLESLRDAAGRELATVANLKAGELSRWREERLGEGRFLQRTRYVVEDIAALLRQPGNAEVRGRVVDWLDPIRGGDRYSEALVFDAGGVLRLAIPQNPDGGGTSEPRGAFPTATAVTLSSMELSESGRPKIDLIVPIFAGGSTAGARIATIVLRIDPAHYLYPMLQRWPTATRTAEVMLVRRDGDEVVYLNNLRGRPDIALKTRIPASSPLRPGAMATRDPLEMTPALSVDGKPILATSRDIPGSPWILIARVDQSEVWAPLRERALRSGLLLVLVLACLALIAVVLLRQKNAASLAGELRLERDRAEAAERFRLVMQHANDVILVLDEQGRILEANDRAAQTYGYTLEEIYALPPGGLLPSVMSPGFTDIIEQTLTEGSARNETLHRRKDGSLVPMEVSARLVEISGRKSILSICRDITERKNAEAAARDARIRAARFSEAMDRIPAFLYMKDLNRRYIYANRPTLELFKVSADELPGTDDSRYFPPEAQAALAQVDERVLGGADTSEEIDVPWAGGSRTYLEVKTPIYEDETRTRIVGLCGISTDITEIKRTEEALRKASAAAEQSPVSIVITDTRGKIEYVNPHFCKVTGYEAGEVIGKNPRLLKSGETPDEAYLELWNTVTRGGVWEGEFHNRRKDGTLFWEHASISPVRDAFGRITSFVAVKEDITARRAAEHALRDSEERHRLLADNATDVIWTTDTEGRFTYVSPSVEKRRGYTVAEVMAQGFAATLTPASAAIATARFREIKERLAEGLPFEPFTLEIEQPCRDGATVWSEVSISGLFGPDGRFLGALGVSRDIGERKRAQERLAGQLDELLRWQTAMLNREGRIQELKREVNDLCARLGRPLPYPAQAAALSRE